MPFTSGFWAKFSVIDAAAKAGSYWLAVVAMVSAVIAAFAYLRVVVAMYFGGSGDSAGDVAADTAADSEAARDGEPRADVGIGAGVVIAIAVLITVAAGIAPAVLESVASTAAGL